MTKNKDTKEVATVSETGFAIIDQPHARETMQQAFEQLGITPDLLQRIKLPTGGMTAFLIDDLDGEQVVKNLDVILVAVQGRQKAWWSRGLDEGGGGAPPSCSSTDGIHGFGINTLNADDAPGKHLCSECPWGRFGSSRHGGNGKDCKDFSLLFFFREGSRIPAMMQVPATSLKALQTYIMRLIDNGKTFQGVVTRLSLSTAQSAGGITYSKLTVAFLKDLDAEAAAVMTALGADLAQQLASFNAFKDSAE